MFRIDKSGRVVKEVFTRTSHKARVVEAVERPRDFTSLTKDSWVDQLLLLDIVASSLAPTNALCYSRMFMHLEVWCQANRRSSMPATPDTVALFLTTLAIRKNTLPPVLGLRAAIRFYHTVHHPDSPLPNDSTRVSLVMNGIKKNFTVRLVRRRQSL